MVVTGFIPLDRQHRQIDRCLAELADAVRLRESSEARGRCCLLLETLEEHFAAEEGLMHTRRWSPLDHHRECHTSILLQVGAVERRLARHGLSHELAAWAVNHIPEILRFHAMASDFGFGKFALGVAGDPGPFLARWAVAG